MVKPSLETHAKDLSQVGRVNLIRSIALHEVLHAFGIAHEAIHPDSTCTTGSDSAFNERIHTRLSEFDSDSIMNSCANRSHDYETRPRGLSALDLQGLNAYFDK